MALAEKLLAAEFNKPEGFPIVDHYTYTFLGDGCLMEGISHEACSLAGTWGSGQADRLLRRQRHLDRRPRRRLVHRRHAEALRSLRLARHPDVDGHDVVAVDRAIAAAKAQNDKPTLICCKTMIGKGSPNKAGTHDVHGAPLGKDEIAATRAALGSPRPFESAADVRAAWDARKAGAKREAAEWQALFAAYARRLPAELAAEFERRMKGELPPTGPPSPKACCKASSPRPKSSPPASPRRTRSRRWRRSCPNSSAVRPTSPVQPDHLEGLQDVRPEAMAEGGNYISLRRARVRHGRDHERPGAARRLPLRRHLPDVLGIRPQRDPHGGADEASTRSTCSRTIRSASAKTARRTSRSSRRDLRMVPNLDVWRPCDTSSRPPSRPGKPKAIIIATGSEVEIALKAQAAMEAEIPVRVVSMPSTNVFDRQDAAYRDSVLLKGVPRIAVEAGVTDGWYKYVGLEGAVVGLDRFGESAPAGALFKEFGFTVANLVKTVEQFI
jgi:transketolase